MTHQLDPQSVGYRDPGDFPDPQGMSQRHNSSIPPIPCPSPLIDCCPFSIGSQLSGEYPSFMNRSAFLPSTKDGRLFP